MNRKLQLTKYILADVITSLVSWSIFCLYQAPEFQISDIPADYLQFISDQYIKGLFLIPLFWLFIYYMSGYYKEILRKSRLEELWQTFGNALTGSVLLYFIVNIAGRSMNYSINTLFLFLGLFVVHFIITYIPRVIITTITNYKIHTGKAGFNTIIVGNGSHAFDIWNEVTTQKKSNGCRIIGYVSISKKNKDTLEKVMTNLGTFEHLQRIINDKKIEEVIMAPEPSEHHAAEQIINALGIMPVKIRAIPSMYDILAGSVRMNSILDTPLILISHSLMPGWQENVKQFLDYFIASVALILNLPIFIIIIAGIKLTSKGPVFYSHERVGRHGKPFKIYKFRSMYTHAEKNGPELASRKDERVTPFGKFMRKTRLDEIPNFLNVIKGDMSLVGPRPERKHFIDQIVKVAPHYLHLLKVKPGITSWGQVKYGYAESVEQMIHRLKYDLIYLENMSLFVDFKIIIYTILTIIKRKGI